MAEGEEGVCMAEDAPRRCVSEQAQLKQLSAKLREGGHAIADEHLPILIGQACSGGKTNPDPGHGTLLYL